MLLTTHTKKGNEISTNATTKETWEILQEKIIIKERKKDLLTCEIDDGGSSRRNNNKSDRRNSKLKLQKSYTYYISYIHSQNC